MSGNTTTKVPPLESSDRLTRPELKRRYQTMSRIKKAELIEGVVYMTSPVRMAQGKPNQDYRQQSIRLL